MRKFWRWLRKPVVSIADGLLLITLTCGADALKLATHLSWGLVILTGWGAYAAAFFLIGFARGLRRRRPSRNGVCDA